MSSILKRTKWKFAFGFTQEIQKLGILPAVKIRFFSDISLIHPGMILEVNGKRILVDPGPDHPRRRAFYCLSQYDLPKLDAIILSHYHGDHSSLTGMILESNQFKGKIFCHAATAEIMEAYYDNIGDYQHQFVKLDYGNNFLIFDAISATLFNAGHVLGSSIISINYEEKNIMITGDLGAKWLPLVRDPDTILPPHPIDLLVIDAKQVHKKKMIDSEAHPVGDILYHKLRDCFMFDNGNILIYAPLVQIPSLIYCLNYIFENKKFADVTDRVDAIYLDPQPKLLELLDIFKNYTFLFDKEEREHVYRDTNLLSFDKLKKDLPAKDDVRNSIIITPNRNVFVRFFETFKRSEENDVLLLNDTIFHALKDSSSRIDKFCNIQIKRLPFLHYHPDVAELTSFCRNLKDSVGVKKIVLYHYRDPGIVGKLKSEIEKKIGGVVELVHCLKNNTIII